MHHLRSAEPRLRRIDTLTVPGAAATRVATNPLRAPTPPPPPPAWRRHPYLAAAANTRRRHGIPTATPAWSRPHPVPLSLRSQRRLFRTHDFDDTLRGYTRRERPGLIGVANIHMGSYQRGVMSSAAQPRWWALAGILSGVALLLAYNRMEIPYIHRLQFIGIPVAVDVGIGDDLYDSLCLEVLPEGHPVSRRAHTVMGRLLLAMREDSEGEPHLKVCSGWEWALCVAADPSQRDAYSLPGGKLVVSQGLVEGLSVAQLAFVIGHEMGHAIARHGTERRVCWHLRRWISDFVANGSGLSQMVHSWVIDFPYSRQVESEADLIGLCLATSAGFSLTESDISTALKDTHSDGSCSGDGGDSGWSLVEGLFDTHPTSADRVSQLLLRFPEITASVLGRKRRAQEQGLAAFHAVNDAPLGRYRCPHHSSCPAACEGGGGFAHYSFCCGRSCECGGAGCDEGVMVVQQPGSASDPASRLHALHQALFIAVGASLLFANVCSS